MKFKKTSFILGTSAILGSTITTLVSCSSSSFNGRYDTENDEQIIMRTTWSQSGGNYSKYHILDMLVHTYNEQMKSTDGFMPVKLEHVEGGYGTIASQTITKIKAGDKKTLPNIFTDYSTSAAEILGYEMDLHFNEQSTFNSSNIDSSWLKNANIIGGNNKNNIINIPYSISSDTLSFNKSLMHKFLIDIQNSNTATINQSANGILHDFFSFTPSSNDTSEINKLWGNITNSNVFNNYTISDSTFNSFESLFEFGSKIMKGYGLNAQDTNGLHFIGYDSPTNLLYSIAKSLSNSSSDYDNLVSLDEKGYVLYDLFKKDKAQKTFKDATKIISDAINTGALWVGTGGAYASDYFKRHKMGMSIGSSAGLTYQVSSVDEVSKIKLENKDVFGVQAHKSGDIVTNVSLNGSLNRIYTHDKNLAANSHDFKFKTSGEETKVTNSKFIVTPTNEIDSSFLSSHSGVPFTVVDGHNVDHTFYAFDTSTNTVISSALLNDNEMISYPAILSATSNSSSKILFTNGPNLVGVHANAAEDKATALFATWLYDFNTNYTGLDNLSPAKYLISKAEYIVPLKDFLKTNSVVENAIQSGLSSPSAKYWKGNKYVFDGLNRVKSDTNVNLYVENVPIDEFSQSMREYIDKIFQATLDGAHQGTTLSVDEIYSKLKSSAKSSGMIQ